MFLFDDVIMWGESVGVSVSHPAEAIVLSLGLSGAYGIMQPGVVRKLHWSMTLLSISEILAVFITTLLSTVSRETIDTFAQSKVNIVRFCK